MKVRLRFFKLAVLGFVAGCTGLSPERFLANKQEFMISQGNPPTYVAGYIDGCSSGRRLAGDKGFVYRKNNTRFEKDALYARGWQEGQINCRNEALEEAVRSASANGTEMVVTTKVPEPESMAPPVDAKSRAEEIEMRQIWEELKK